MLEFKHISLSSDTSIRKDLSFCIEDFWTRKWENVPIWQTIRWALFLCNSSQISEGIFSGVYQEGVLVGYTITQIRSIGLGKMGGFILGWPSYIRGTPEIKKSFERELGAYMWSKDLLFLQYECLENTAQTIPQGNWKTFIEPYTLEIDLTFSSDDLLAQMKPKGRYNIKLAEKQWIKVRKWDQSRDIEVFMKLLGETLARDGFAGNSRAYYEWLLAICTHPTEGLYVAEYEGETIAAAILVRSGDRAIYYYGASTSDNLKRKYMPAYLLQWEMIMAAQKWGCRVYDFLGIAPPDLSDHHLAGVSDFKHKFWGKIIAYMPTQIQVFQRLNYTFLRYMRGIRSLFR